MMRQTGRPAHRYLRARVEGATTFASDNMSLELAGLAELDLTTLRSRWLQVTGRDAPTGFRRELLRRALAHEIQVKQFGGLSAPLKRRLRQLADAAREDRFDEALGTSPMKPGTVLVRVWQGQSHRVTIIDKGFVWDGKTFRSLSTIAKAITGTTWNGWVFFGAKRPKGRNKNALKQSRADDAEVSHA